MVHGIVHHEFSNIGHRAGGRAFPGMPPKSDIFKKRIGPRAALKFDIERGDVFSAFPLGPSQSVQLYVVDEHGKPAPQTLGLICNSRMDCDCFENAPFKGWVAANGGEVPNSLNVTSLDLNDLAVLKSKGKGTLWVFRSLSPADLVSQASTGLIDVALKKASAGSGPLLPEPLGKIREEFTVKRGTAGAYEVKAGEIIQIIDVEGQQCSDFMAHRLRPLDDNVEMTIDSTATRSMVRGAYPGPGLLDKFYDRELRPMLNVVQDTCGRHDTFGMACTARGYEERGFPGHVNCSDNISYALDPFGVARRPAWPAINFFWNTWVDEQSHGLMTEESYSRPGDYVAMQAMDDLVCVTTACPDDLDPINGWNPTDVHVRIYRQDAPIKRAVAHREKEDAPMSISQESAFHPATSKLTTHFAPARDLWAPVSYPAVGTIGEYWACREKVTLQDMSSLRKYDIVGPDAEVLVQKAMTRDISRLAVWRGTYALICDKAGAVIDDGTLFRLAPDLFRWCCGTEESARVLEEIAEVERLQVRVHGMGSAMPNLALQGPMSRDVLRKIAFTQPTVPSLDALNWFGVTVARVKDREGIPFMLSRTGYTGELGYELFCAEKDAVGLWDAVMAAGQEFGIQPMGADALDIIRIEAGLASGGAEFAPGVDAFEAGLGFAVSLRKPEFQGQDALQRNAREPRRKLRGLMFDCNDLPAHGAHIFSGERPIGVVTSATRSPMFGHTIAMARIAVEFAGSGTWLEVGQMDGHIKRLRAKVCDIPFFDPKRERARA